MLFPQGLSPSYIHSADIYLIPLPGVFIQFLIRNLPRTGLDSCPKDACTVSTYLDLLLSPVLDLGRFWFFGWRSALRGWGGHCVLNFATYLVFCHTVHFSSVIIKPVCLRSYIKCSLWCKRRGLIEDYQENH